MNKEGSGLEPCTKFAIFLNISYIYLLHFDIHADDNFWSLFSSLLCVFTAEHIFAIITCLRMSSITWSVVRLLCVCVFVYDCMIVLCVCEWLLHYQWFLFSIQIIIVVFFLFRTPFNRSFTNQSIQLSITPRNTFNNEHISLFIHTLLLKPAAHILCLIINLLVREAAQRHFCPLGTDRGHRIVLSAWW